MNKVYLLLGGNIGNVKESFLKVENILKGEISVTKKSNLYITQSWGFEANDFINQVWEILTNLNSIGLLDLLQKTEIELGRIKNELNNEGYQSRIIDIDILLFNDLILNNERLSIPHPRMAERKFVLEPLAELVPNFKHPIYRKTIKELLLHTTDVSRVKKIMKIPYKYISIEGNIGSGKTSLCKKFSQEFNGISILEEFEENPFLAEFLSDQQPDNLAVELHFLLDRFKQLTDGLNVDNLIFSDYHPHKSLIFSEANLSDLQRALFKRIFDILLEKNKKPDLLIYLSVDVERLLLNIKKRGRDFEQSISKEYLSKVHSSYLSYFSKHLANQKIVIVDTTNMNFVDNENDYKFLKDVISKKHPYGISYF